VVAVAVKGGDLFLGESAGGLLGGHGGAFREVVELLSYVITS
jgi:hypothetical protein